MNLNHKKPRVLMIGPGRNVMGGITTVVNLYYELGLDQKVDLYYLTTMVDGSKLKKAWIALKAYIFVNFKLKRSDIVHIHMAAQASFYRKSLFIKKAKKRGKKIIIHQHAGNFDDFYFNQIDGNGREKVKEVFRCADKVIVLSEEWKTFFSKYICNAEKVIVLHNGIVPPERIKKKYDDHNSLFLGRLGEKKGIYDLLEAIPKVLEIIPNAVFYFGGDGDIEQIKKIIKDKKLEQNVKLLGWIGQLEKEQYQDKCSVFLLPSYYEGMPMAVLEAMGCGMATISTNVGSIPKMIDHGVDGIRIDAGNVQDLANSIIRLHTDEKLKCHLGYKAAERIRNDFNANCMIHKLTGIYDDINNSGR